LPSWSWELSTALAAPLERKLGFHCCAAAAAKAIVCCNDGEG
jgi:hypothetical protein